MATEQELYEAVKRNLNKEGLTGKIKSEIRYEVLRLLGISGLKKDKNKPGLPHELGLINSLLKEYLNWVGYNFTSMMLSAESSSDNYKNQLTRTELEKELKIEAIGEENSDLPLLFILINHLKENYETDDSSH